MRSAIIVWLLAGGVSCASSRQATASAREESANVLPASTGATPALSDDAGAALEGYRHALLAKDGQAAAAFVTQSTFDYYAQRRQDALVSVAAVVRELSLVDQFMVLRFRHEFTAEQLKAMDGRALFAHGVNAGWISVSSVQSLRFGPIQVAGTEATAPILGPKGTASPFVFRFRREQGEWRVDVLHLVSMGAPLFEQMQQTSGKAPSEFLLGLLSEVSGRKPDESIWHPLQ